MKQQLEDLEFEMGQLQNTYDAIYRFLEEISAKLEETSTEVSKLRDDLYYKNLI